MPQNALKIDSVAVVGAGPCGLAAAKYLIAEKKFSRVEVFDQRPVPGGIWNYSSLTVIDNGFTVPRTRPTDLPDTVCRVEGSVAPNFVSPVYDMLETNIPHTLMNYADTKFPDNTSLFPEHSVVKSYLHEYAAELKPHLTLSTQVLSIKKAPGTGSSWVVETLDLKTNSTKQAEFDAVMVASGHYNDPFIPDIPNVAAFNEAYPGSISHSKFYRNPAQYKEKKVVVVGNSASGIDLSAQIATVCKQPVIVSEKSTPNTPSEEQSWAKFVPEITKFDARDRSVYFANGDVETGVDAVVFCTGYFYSYPFLKGLAPPITTDGACAHNLYEHVLYIDDPTLAFVGIPQRIVPFPVSEAESGWVARIWSGRLPVPAVSAMRDWESKLIEEQGNGKALHNLLFPKDLNHINRLHEWSLKAEKNPALDNDGMGKIPPYWDDEMAWVRERFPLIKIASRKLGDKKHEVTTLEALGFDFKAWKASQTDTVEGDNL